MYIYNVSNILQIRCFQNVKDFQKSNNKVSFSAPNQITNIVIGGIAGTVTVLVILLIIIYIKR